jgi:hypothetical protein
MLMIMNIYYHHHHEHISLLFGLIKEHHSLVVCIPSVLKVGFCKMDITLQYWIKWVLLPWIGDTRDILLWMWQPSCQAFNWGTTYLSWKLGEA